MSKRIAVIGCGWLGLPLAREWVAQGHQVYGTTTSGHKIADMAQAGIRPVVLKIDTDQLMCDDHAVWTAEVFIIAIPPGVKSKGEDHHVGQIQTLLQYIPSGAPIIYVSSTSIYPSEAGRYDESFMIDHHNTGNMTLYRTERLIAAHGSHTIVRPGGLLGFDRVSGRYFAGKQTGGQRQPVNYIHQSDAIGLIKGIVEQEVHGLYNLVCPQHPTRGEVYAANSQRFGFEMPQFTDEGVYRLIDGQLLPSILDYTFHYPDPTRFD